MGSLPSPTVVEAMAPAWWGGGGGMPGGKLGASALGDLG